MTVLRCLARRPAVAAFRTAASAANRRQAPTCARSLYTVPSLDRHDQLVANGIPGLFSPTGFQVAFSEYQQHTVDELNNETAGGPYEGQDVKSLVIELARDPLKAYPFNLASMAFNNHFFFRGINTNPDVVSTPPADLAQEIRNDFSSMDTLRETFIATADAMFGPGFVWLVQTNDAAVAGGLRILPTYLAGSPLSGAHYRRQSYDLNNHNPDSYQQLNSVGAFGASSRQDNRPKKPLGGTDIIPLLCVNTWEHAWLHDYGVRGKSDYLRAWWEKIDWDLVRQNASIAQSQGANTNKWYQDESM
ncbi:Fe superoxide dismutase-like protein [Boeremia exigua]|uniref:Fe superoxide dismutase-like protein n=1 Tax=Boeremia exigua TaxID=749465 RepID=UPI001E8E10F6|nr:Fe superoxide dismutase-like protein [Boeremia exigua]KAH6612667.1 Fe superoxide dismutase-like protein [Boeremia exigua]